MKTLFIVDHYVPFPQSEYGGVWNVLADTDEECFDLITSEDSDTYPEFYSCLLYTSPSPRDLSTSRMPSSA